MRQCDSLKIPFKATKNLIRCAAIYLAHPLDENGLAFRAKESQVENEINEAINRVLTQIRTLGVQRNPAPHEFLDSPRVKMELSVDEGLGSSAYIIRIASSNKNVRAACLFDQAVPQLPSAPKTHVAHGMSHLVEICIAKENPGWHPTTGFASARVVVPDLDAALNLIIDVALDIAMFQIAMRPDPDKRPLGFKNFVSASKVSVATEELNGNPTCYGPIHQDVCYVSLASVARSVKSGTGTRGAIPKHLDKYIATLDCKKFVELWQRLSREIGPSDDPKRRFKKGDCDAAFVKNFLASHARIRQLPLAEIAQMLRAAKAGHYVLASIYNRPRRKEVREQVLTLMGGSRWRQNRVRLFPIQRLKEIETFSRYIDAYPILWKPE